MTDPPPPSAPATFIARCMRCGSDLSAQAVSGTCPSCGTPVAVSLRGAPRSARTSVFAVVSFIVGLVSVPLSFCAPFGAIGVVAIVLFFPAIGEVKRGAAGGPSTGFAIAGLILGIISTLLSLTCLGLFLIGEKYNWNG